MKTCKEKMKKILSGKYYIYLIIIYIFYYHSNSDSFQKIDNKISVDENRSKKVPLILFKKDKKDKSKRTIIQDKRNNSKDNLTSKITNNTTNTTNINSNSKIKKKNEEKNKPKKIVQKLECIDDHKRKGLKHNMSYNQKNPKKLNTENNIIKNKKEKIIEKKKYKNYNTNNNEGSSSYIKIKLNKEQSKENKTNISNYDKRRNYNVPKFRIKRTTENETRKNDTTENELDSDLRKNEKEKNVQKLLENNSYIKEYQKILEGGLQTKENKTIENKIKYIEENGYDLDNLEDSDNNEEEIENTEKDNKNKTKNENEKNNELDKNDNNNTNNNLISNNSITNNESSKINNFNFISNNNINMNLSGSPEKNEKHITNMYTDNNQKKEIRKKCVDTMEYCNRINRYINISELKNVYDININNDKDSLGGDSFRRSASNSINQSKKEKLINSNENSSTDSESKFNYNTRKNKRSETEIKEYMERRKKKEKLEKEKKNEKKQADNLKRYLVLNKLNQNISSMVKNTSKIKNYEENNNKNQKKGKILNEYFVGKKDFSLKRKNSVDSRATESSQSTVLDQNNYYLDLIMSKNILSNNMIPNNIIYNNNNNQDNNNEINSDNNAVITTKDKDIQNTYDINTNNSNNKISQEIIKKDIYDELQLKCKETLARANNFFSENNMKELIKQYKENIENTENNEIKNNSNIQIPQHSEEDNNIIIDKKDEKEKDKENNIENISENINKDDIVDINPKNIIEINKNNDDIIVNENKQIEEEHIIEEIKEKEKEEKTAIDIKENEEKEKKIDLKENEKEEKEEKTEIEVKEDLKEEKEIENIKEEIPIQENNIEKQIIPQKKTYDFSKEDLENYYKIFISLEDYLNSLTKKNALNDIITFGDTRIAYKIGLENLILVIKSYPFNVIKNIYQRQYYKDVLRQFFIPYIRKAFNNINLYSFYLFKFSEVNKAIEQIYRIIFMKRLSFYGNAKDIIKKEYNEAFNEFIKKLNKVFKKLVSKKLFQILKSNNENVNEISENNSSYKKYNSYLYESFSEKSSLTAYPNTEGSARLHKVYELLEMQRKPKNEENNNLFEFTDNNSVRSIKSVQENKGKKLFEDLNMPSEELKTDLNKNEINKNIEIINNEKNENYKGCIKKIEITNNFKINKDNNILPNNKENSPLIKEIINNDKKDDLLNSADFNNNIKEGLIEDNDIQKIENNNIIIETNEKKSRNINENKENNKEIKNDNIEITNQSKNNDIIKIPEENNNNNISLGLNLNNNVNKVNNCDIDFEMNDNLRYPKTNNNSERNEIPKDINLDNIINNNINNKILNNLSEISLENITDDICNNIISELILSEIKDKKRVMQKKKKELTASLNNSSCSLHISQNSMSIGSHSPGRNFPSKKNNMPQSNNNNDSYQSINSSQTESVLNNSVFMRTIDEIKKEKNLNLYNEKIYKKFLEKIESNLDKNYEKIIDNIKNPFLIDEAKMINGLMLKDKNLSISSKIRFCNENILKKNNFIDEKIISDFEIIDKKIRSKNNFTKDNILYDNYLNKCVYDTINELIEKERKYGIIGAPLSWSIRNKDIDYKYRSKDNFSKNIFINKIMTQINKIINSKMGLIAENYEYLDMEQLNQDRDKKFMESITQELKDNEPCYQIFETQETYVKLSLSRIILDQLLNEIVEILEHVQYSRKEPDKYQSKSIYACEDIPRLSFQPQTMENNYSGNFEGEQDGDESINQ